MATIARAIFGCSGTELTPDERAFFADARPWGFILFARNIADRQQARRLTDSLRTIREDAPILIDQEGGRVARLRPPEWKARPPARRFGLLYEGAPEQAREATYLNARLMAHDLAEIGVNVDCVPVLDVPVEGANEVIGDRAFSGAPAAVIDLGRAMMEGMLEGGVLPVMKHMPGHGRAGVDTHFALPRVAVAESELSATDFVPFRSLNSCPLGMTAHVVYEAIDGQRPATISPKIIRDVIRGEIGFEGMLLTDDISMQALSGSVGSRTKAALFAGCDAVCHCNGKMEEMTEVAAEAKPLEGPSLKRAQTALSHLNPAEEFDMEAGEARLAELLRAVA